MITTGGNFFSIRVVVQEPTVATVFNKASDDDWECWSNGTSCSGLSFQPAGQRELLEAVRSTGARNVVLLGGMASVTLSAREAEARPDKLRQVQAELDAYKDNGQVSTEGM